LDLTGGRVLDLSLELLIAREEPGPDGLTTGEVTAGHTGDEEGAVGEPAQAAHGLEPAEADAVAEPAQVALVLEPAAGARSRGRRLARLGQALLLSILALFAVVLLLVDVGPHVLPFETMVVQSGSMRPTLAVGSVAIYRHETAAQVKVGQIILFGTPSDAAVLVSHRVYAIVEGPGGKYFVTKGDANPEPDSWRVAAVGSGWYVVGDVPLVGYAIRAIQEPTTKLLLVIVPACLIGLLALSDLVVARRRRGPRPAGCLPSYGNE
jgi:signal peptidase